MVARSIKDLFRLTNVAGQVTNRKILQGTRANPISQES